MTSLGKTLLDFVLPHSVFQDKICLLLQLSLDFLFCIPVPYNENDFFFGCQFQVLQVFIEPFNFSFFSITGWDIDLDYFDTEWFALEANRDYSVILWVQQTQVWQKPSWRSSPFTPPQSCQNLHRTEKQTLGRHKKKLVHTGTQEKGAVIPQETDPDLPKSVQGSPVEVWVGSGLLQGWGY